MPVNIPITFGGAAPAADGVNELADALERGGVATGNFADAETRAAMQMIQMTQRGAALAGALANLHLNPRIDEMARFTQQTLGAAAAGAQMGLQFGPQGALLGGVIGLSTALPTLIERIGGMNRVIDEIDVSRLEQTATAMEAIARAVPQYGHAQEAMERLGRLLQEPEGEDFLAGAGTGAQSMSEFLRRRREEERRRRHRGGELESAASVEELQAIADQMRLEERRLDLISQQEHAMELRNLRHAEALRLMDEEAHKLDAAREQAVIDEQTSMDRMRAQQEADHALIERHRQEYQRSRESTQEFASVVGEANGMFIDAISQTIAGTKSADEAFKGLLKGFLEMISRMAALKAAEEYAEGIASFARYDYSGGAQHVAAGVAFTAVAIATGVGAAALAPPQQEKPAEPAQGGRGDSQQRSDVNVYINSPILTAGTHAELGRTIKNAIAVSDRLGI